MLTVYGCCASKNCIYSCDDNTCRYADGGIVILNGSCIYYNSFETALLKIYSRYRSNFVSFNELLELFDHDTGVTEAVINKLEGCKFIRSVKKPDNAEHMVLITSLGAAKAEYILRSDSV